jgi:serine/threonine protein phosphatase PrpC
VNWDDIIIDAVATDTGMRRSNNQDSHSVVRASTHETWKHRGHLFMVADGMGAHAVGELASKLACDNIPHNYTKTKTGNPAEAITKAYKEVGGLIHSRASANRDFQGMGTTCSTLLLLPEGALIAHVGDSRVYRIRNHRIDQLSFDHSLVWELVRRNHLTPEHANLAVP